MPGELIAGLPPRSSHRWQQIVSTSVHGHAHSAPSPHDAENSLENQGLRPASDRQAAKVFNITLATAGKYLKRNHVQGLSHRNHTLHATLSATR